MADPQPSDVTDLVASVLIEHTRINGIAGDCSCGHVVPLGKSFARHQAAAVVAALVERGARDD
jgi:hypothetical protein